VSIGGRKFTTQSILPTFSKFRAPVVKSAAYQVDTRAHFPFANSDKMAKERARDASPEAKVKKRSSDDKVKKSKSKKDKMDKREKKEKKVKKIKEIVEEELEVVVEEKDAEDLPPGSPSTMVEVKDKEEVPATKVSPTNTTTTPLKYAFSLTTTVR
jgi:hypothetical protein